MPKQSESPSENRFRYWLSEGLFLLLGKIVVDRLGRVDNNFFSYCSN